MEGDPVTFQPHEDAEKVARTFERDDLLSAAVIDADGKLMGRLTIDGSSTWSMKRRTTIYAGWAA